MPIRKLWYADLTAFTISDRLTRGYVYSDWPEFEEYVNAVLQRVIPPGFEGREAVHAYVVRDGEYNASMTGAGFMFVNIGLLSELRDEASLAAVLCHELAHHQLDHAFDWFYGQAVLHEGEGALGDKRTSLESVRMEVQADSLAMVWMQASDYDLVAMYDGLRVLDRLEKQDNRLRRSRWGSFGRGLPTHPGATERLAAFLTYYSDHKDETGARFLVDESAFARFREDCKSEILAVLLDDMNYRRCIGLAFTYHLLEPEESAYMWYLMEALRRMCYLNSDRWDEFFIKGNYTDQVRTAGDDDELAQAHLFTSFDMDVMGMDPALLPKIKAKFYWQEEAKFITNREAFEFFEQVAAVLGCHECLLSSALACRRDSTRSDSLLTSYLHGDAHYSAYAEDLLGKNATQASRKGKLLVFAGLTATIKQGPELIPAGAAVGEDDDQLQRLVDSLTVLLPGRRVISLAAEKYRSLERNIRLRELWTFSAFSTVAKGEPTELKYLDPRHHEFFVQEGVDEIDFVSCDYTELRGKTISLEAYEAAAATDYRALFDQTSGNRYLNTIVRSIREVPKSPMKFRSFGSEVIIKNGRLGLSEIVYDIKRTLEQKEEQLRVALINWYK